MTGVSDDRTGAARGGTKLRNRSMAPGVIIPELDYEDVNAAAAWLCRAFGFEERLRIASHRVQITFIECSINNATLGHVKG